jgi:excisionase family DNA binding protein
MAERLTLTIEETAELLGVGRSTCYDAARRGEIPTLKLGRRLLVPRLAVVRLVGAGNGPRNDPPQEVVASDPSDNASRHGKR